MYNIWYGHRVSLESLLSIGGAFSMQYNYRLTGGVVMPNLATVGSYMSISQNSYYYSSDGMRTLDLGSLEHVGSYFSVYNNDQLVSMNLTKLHTISDSCASPASASRVPLLSLTAWLPP